MRYLMKKLLPSKIALNLAVIFTTLGLTTAVNAGVVRVPFTLAAGTNTIQSYNFGDVGQGQYVYATFSYKNTSTSSFEITGSTTEGGAEVVSTDCGSSLDAQATCNVIVGFSVSELGVNTGSVKFSTSAYSKPDVFSVSAVGISSSSVLTVTPGDAQFTRSSEEQTFTVSNPRNYSVTIDNVLPSASYWSVSSNSCKTELQPNASCIVKVKYVTSKTGNYSGVLRVLSQSVLVGQANLTGSLQYGSPSFSVNSINLPSLMVGTPYTGSLNVTNVGKGALVITDSFFESDVNSLSFQSDDCKGKSLAYNESCAVQYKILFSSAGNVQNGIGFRFLNASTTYSTVGLFASAISANPVLSVSPTVLDYSSNAIGATKSLAVTIGSIGNAPVKVTDIKIAGTGSSAYSILNKSQCIGDLTEGNQCTINVQYTAPVTTTSLTSVASLSFVSNSNTAVPSVTLTGTSAKPLLAIDPTTQAITGTSGQNYFKDYLVTNKSILTASLTSVSINNSIYNLDGSTCIANKALAPNETCNIKVNLNNAQVGTGSGTITVKYGTDSLTANINHNIEAAFATANLGEISCPDVSVATNTPAAISNTSPYACSLQVTNPGEASLYLPNGSVTRSNDTGSFTIVPGTQAIATNVFGYIIPPKSNLKLLLTHSVPTTAGTIKADFNIKVYGKAGVESTATLFNRSAIANVVAANFELSDVVCPASTYVSQNITCTANLYNKSLTEFSTLVGGANLLTAGNQIAAKFSATTVNGAAINSLATLKPTKDTLPTALAGVSPGFFWSTSVPSSCTQGSSAGNIIPGGKCAVSISFTPTIAGTYVIPLWAVSNVNVSNWVRANIDATFVAKPVVTDLVATPFDCVSVYPNAVGTCTTTLTNATPTGIANSFSVPTISAIGSASALLEKVGAAYKVSHTCGTSIAPGVSCKLSLTFKGTEPGTYYAKIRLTSNNQTDDVDMSPIILTPNITLSSFDCPPVFVGSGSTCTATLTNGMTTGLTVATVTSSNLSGFGVPTITTKSLAAGAVANIGVPYTFNTVGTFTTDVTVTTNFGTFKGPASVTVKPVPPAGDDTVSDIICPSSSAGWAVPYAVDAGSAQACYSVIKNSTSAALFIPNTAIVRSADTGSFVAKLSSSFMTGTSTFGYTIPANSSIKLFFGYTVPINPGTVGATFTLKTYTKAGVEATATSFTRSATAAIVPMSVTVEDVVCPSALVTQDVKCTANIYNKSLTKQSVFTAGSNLATNAIQLGAKFSGVTVDGSPISSKVTAPSKDYLPTALNGLAPSFNWTITTSPVCTAGSTITTIIPGGKCSVSITFKPTIAGTYSVPLAAISNVDSARWPTAVATFEVKNVVLDLVASPFECVSVYPNVVGTCTSTLTNFTPVGVNNTYSLPSVTLTGLASGVVAKNTNGTAKTTTNCPAVGIAPGASCKLSVTYSSATSGAYAGKATISSNGQSDEVDLVPVVMVPDISVTPFTCPAAAVGEAGVCTATFKNGMTTSITVTSVTKTGDVNFGLPVMAVKTVPAGQTSAITLPYKFTTAGTFNATVNVATMYGTLTSPASVTTQNYPPASGGLSPFTCPTLYYGQSGVCTATLTNLSAQRSLAVSTVAMPNNTNKVVFKSISHNCGTTIAPAGTCTVSVNVTNDMRGGNGIISTDAVVTTTPVLTQPVPVEVKPALFSVTQPAPLKISSNTEGRITVSFKNETAVPVPVFAKNMALLSTSKTNNYYIISNECDGVKAPQQVCNVIVGIKSIVAGAYTANLSLDYGAGTATAALSAEVIIPSLKVEPLYDVSSLNVGVGSKSGNWYKVTNISPDTTVLTKFTPAVGTQVYMDANSAGNCGVGKAIPPYGYCVFMEGHAVSTQSALSVKMAGMSSVESSNKLKGVWNPVYTTYLLNLELVGITNLNGITGDTLQGTLKITNPTDGPVQGIAVNQKLSVITGDFRWTNQGCSGAIGSKQACYQTFEYTFKPNQSGTLEFNAYASFARLINNKQQDWGDNVLAGSLKVPVSTVIPMATIPTVTYRPTVAYSGYNELLFEDSIVTNTGTATFTIKSVQFYPGSDIYLQYAGDCIGKTLAPKQTCAIRTRFDSNKAPYNGPSAKIEITVTGGTIFTGYVRVQPPANQSKLCTFGETQTFTSEFTGCARNVSAVNGPAACSPAYNWNSWLDPIFFDGTPVYKDNKIVTPAKPLTWKSSGLPVTQVITKVGNVSYGFNVKPVLQIYMGGKWTAMWGGSGSSGTALAISRSNGIYNYGFGSGTSFAVPADVGGGANPLYSPNGSAYTEFISTGTTIGGYYARQAWIEITPGPNCHQPGSFLANE